VRANLSGVLTIGSILVYLGATGLIVASLLAYVRALIHPSQAPVQHRRQVKIWAAIGSLFVFSLILSPRGSTAMLVAAATVMVATNLDLLRRDARATT
jgi:hypothetical protein